MTQQTTPPRLLRQITEIKTLPMDALKARWEVLIGTKPPAYNRTYLENRLIYRLQEIAYGGMAPETREQMATLLEATGHDEQGVQSRRVKQQMKGEQANRLLPGTRLVREWQGQTYQVLVTPRGYEMEGIPYRSLTAVAKAITGQHMNGWVFFGLRPNEKEKTS
ncbi:MAG: DUF2924 domain-containing protein [Armatimonadota bacterium]